jgi:O-antigen/teichoic acid export membrane protein
MLRRTYRFFTQDYLLRNSAILAAGALSTGALNYLFQLFTARLMTVEEYGVMGAFNALFYIITFSGQALSLFATKNAVLSKTEEERAYVMRRGLFLISAASIAFYALYMLLSPFLTSFLHVSSYVWIMLAGIIMVLNLIYAVIVGFGRGLEDFFNTTLSNASGTAIKLVLGIGLVLIGYSVEGALGGIIFGIIASILYLLYRYRRYLLMKSRSKVHISAREFIWYFLALFLSVLFIDLDMLLVKYLFSSFDAGSFAALSLLGKIIFFIAGGSIPVIFPKVIKHIDSNEHSVAAAFYKKTMLYCVLVGGAVVAAYALFPQFITTMLFGNKYPIAHLLFYEGLTVLIYVLLSIQMMYAVALRKLQVIWTLLFGNILQLVLIIMFHETLAQVLLSSLAAISITMVVCSAQLHLLVPRKRRADSQQKPEVGDPG